MISRSSPTPRSSPAIPACGTSWSRSRTVRPRTATSCSSVPARLPARLRHARIGTTTAADLRTGCTTSALTRRCSTRSSTTGASACCGSAGCPGEIHAGLTACAHRRAEQHQPGVRRVRHLQGFRSGPPGRTRTWSGLGAAQLARRTSRKPFGWVETRIDGATTCWPSCPVPAGASDGGRCRDQRARPVRHRGRHRAAEAAGTSRGAERLGAATAQVHRDLADAFGRSSSSRKPSASCEQMYRRSTCVAPCPSWAGLRQGGNAYSDWPAIEPIRPAGAPRYTWPGHAEPRPAGSCSTLRQRPPLAQRRAVLPAA